MQPKRTHPLFHRALHLIGFISTFAAILGFGFFYIHLLRPESTTLGKPLSQHHIDYSITQLSVKDYSPEGVCIHALHTPLIQHLTKKNGHVLQKPHITLSETNQSYWDIHAQKGYTFKNDVFTLIHNVKIEQPASIHKPATLLTTEKISYYSKEKQAKTTDAVTIQQAENKVHAIGMNADLAENKIELLSQVRGRYEPKKSD